MYLVLPSLGMLSLLIAYSLHVISRRHTLGRLSIELWLSLIVSHLDSLSVVNLRLRVLHVHISRLGILISYSKYILLRFSSVFLVPVTDNLRELLLK